MPPTVAFLSLAVSLNPVPWAGSDPLGSSFGGLGGGMVSISRSSDSDSERICGLVEASCSSLQSSPLVFMKRSGSVPAFVFLDPSPLLSAAVSSRGTPWHSEALPITTFVSVT